MHCSYENTADGSSRRSEIYEYFALKYKIFSPGVCHGILWEPIYLKSSVSVGGCSNVRSKEDVKTAVL